MISFASINSTICELYYSNLSGVDESDNKDALGLALIVAGFALTVFSVGYFLIPIGCLVLVGMGLTVQWKNRMEQLKKEEEELDIELLAYDHN